MIMWRGGGPVTGPCRGHLTPTALPTSPTRGEVRRHCRIGKDAD